MSYRNHFDKPDKVTQQIVDELRALHFSVEFVGRPVDLLVRKAAWPPNRWAMIEVKRPANKKGEPKLDKRQKDQAEFCAEYGVPYVTNTLQAIEYLTTLRW
jgi:hypothetical protein